MNESFFFEKKKEKTQTQLQTLQQIGTIHPQGHANSKSANSLLGNL
jgi:hypothetical protein